MMEAIICEQISKSYGAQRVLNEISFRVGAGEYVGLIGANGAGKTTLIKAMLDLTSVDQGQFVLNGQSHLTPSARSNLAYLPERFIPPHFVTGRDVLLHLARMYHTPVSEALIEQALDAVAFDLKMLTKPVRAMSKGMVQKIGLAAVLMSEKACLILDEPMSGLDPKARVAFKSALLARRSETKSLFFSTHLLVDVERLCDQIVILHEGRIRFHGSPAACCAQYRAADLEQAYISSIS